jgi:uncharacterized membrane protein
MTLEKYGCLGCHSKDGSPLRGPTFRGLSGKSRVVLKDGNKITVVADREYIERAILAPDAEVVEGYTAMPKLAVSPEDAKAIALEIEQMKDEGPPPPVKTVTLLGASAAAFVGLHVILSSIPVRKRLIGGIGAGGFMGLYSIIALVSFAGIVLGFRNAPYVQLWTAPAWTRWLPNVFVPIAYVLLVCALSTKSPTMAGKPGAEPVREAIGIVRVTRHPMLWAFALWGLAHIPPNGDLRSLILFSSIAALAIIGMLHIDARRAAAFPDAWAPIKASTSVLPFAAIASGRNKLVLREIGIVRVLIGLFFWAAFLHLHRAIIGVSPLP